jgi:hypothetical protein
MDLALPEVATQFADALERAVLDHGGIELARRAEADPTVRGSEARALLDALGLPDLDPRADLESACVAAEAVRIAGRYVVPFPVISYLMAHRDDPAHDPIPLALAKGSPRRVDHGDLFGAWDLLDFDGTTTRAAPAKAPLASRLAPFVTPMAAQGPQPPAGPGEVALLCTLSASYLLGLAEAAVELAVAHVKARVQYGRPLAELQSVRFAIADATVAVDGLRELVRFTLWRVASDPARSLGDALAARLHAQEVAQPTLRVTQQLHGAAGLCDEYDISVLVRHLQPALRLPLDADATSDLLFDVIATEGFATLFPLAHGARGPE